jgi:hypothetical protein
MRNLLRNPQINTNTSEIHINTINRFVESMNRIKEVITCIQREGPELNLGNRKHLEA